MRAVAPQTLHARLVLSHLTVALVSIVLISAFAGRSIFNAAREQIGHNSEDLAFAASNVLEKPLFDLLNGQADQTALEEAVRPLFDDNSFLDYTVFSLDGTPLANKSGELPEPVTPETAPEIWEAVRSEIGEGERIRYDESGEQLLYIAVRIMHEDEVQGILRLEAPMDPSLALSIAQRSLILLLLTDLTVTLGVSLFGWTLANTIARPIEDLTETADQLARGDLGARVVPTGPQEMHHLALSFNTMAGRLQDHFNELRAFVANASHELRTPLTVVKLRAEALRYGALQEQQIAEQFLTEIEEEVDRLSSMVSDMLDLSRLEAGLETKERSRINLAATATDVYETFSIRAARDGVELQLHIEPGLPIIEGDEDQLRRVLYNLVENAIRYTPPGGRVDVFLQTGQGGRSVRLLVKDTGIGIAPNHIPHIFERFYRVEATRPRYGVTSKGSGLGLAIAKSIVENHGGRIGVSSQLQQGTTFWAELPVAA